jgi:hypothetical protein
MTMPFTIIPCAASVRSAVLSLFRPVRRYWSAWGIGRARTSSTLELAQGRRGAACVVPLASEVARVEGDRIEGVFAPLAVLLDATEPPQGCLAFPLAKVREPFASGPANDADWAHWITASQPFDPGANEVGFLLYSLQQTPRASVPTANPICGRRRSAQNDANQKFGQTLLREQLKSTRNPQSK